MRAVVQKVSEASVSVGENLINKIERGLLVFLGIEHADTEEDLKWLSRKVSQLRIFEDEDGKMNRSVVDLQGELLVISQFTLHASTKKGTRPSFIRAAEPQFAKELYQNFINEVKNQSGLSVFSGVFGAHMMINLVNDGPVTIIIDSKNRE